MMDMQKMAAGFRMILEGMGENPDREGLIDTPKRVAKMYAELMTGFLPFTGRAHVAYIPGDCVVGLSKIPRVVEFYARFPQIHIYFKCCLKWGCLWHPKGMLCLKINSGLRLWPLPSPWHRLLRLRMPKRSRRREKFSTGWASG